MIEADTVNSLQTSLSHSNASVHTPPSEISQSIPENKNNTNTISLQTSTNNSLKSQSDIIAEGILNEIIEEVTKEPPSSQLKISTQSSSQSGLPEMYTQ
jgi:hypothetical protein